MRLHTSRFTVEDIEHARQRATLPRWSASREQLAAKAQAFHSEGIAIPEFDASWYDPDVPYSETYQQFHGYIFGHRPLFANISTQLLAGLILNNDAYRRQAMQFALSLAEAIDFRVMHYDSGMEFGNVGWMLCDALLAARDLLQDDEESRLLAQIRNAADAVTRCNEYWREHLAQMAFSNHLICHLGARLAMGAVLGDDSLIAPAFDPTDDRCFLNYLDGAVYDDGLCYESSLHYHYATTSFLVKVASAQRALLPDRPDLFHLRGANGRSLESYLSGPLATAFPDLDMPRVGDNYGASTTVRWPIYFIGYAIYNNPIYGRLAQEQADQHPALALAFAPDEPINEPYPAPTSRLFPEHGYALLCDAKPVYRQAFLAGDRSGIHHQHDGLQLQVMIGDEIVLYCTDIKPKSLHGFSDSIHKEYNHWAQAHSQLTVDELDQKTYASPIPIHEWSPDARIKRMAMVDEFAMLQDGVHQGRFVSMADDWVCDCVIAAATEERTWRLFYHLPQGAPEVDAPDSALQSNFALQSPNQPPWHLMQIEGGSAPASAHTWPSGKANFQLATNDESVLQRFSVPAYEGGRVGLFAQQRGQHAVYITLMSPSAGHRISGLDVRVLGNELVARWFVDHHGERTRLQARINLP
ncbi:hypothetical protein [Cerasicoccus fimbriatus]|uniref:hypothetical protein n=1 Tax=Cerasicoccus fimbriatus TaxID=3014554 RepID=UPI0022B43C73|nr:hypothetical protein [Cerasicoccus sp. TK19100]